MKKYFLILIFLLPTLVSATTLSHTLYYGLRNNSEVKTLQTILINKGYLVGTPTGNFLSFTRQAVINFQKANHISPTGTVGPLTRAALLSYTTKPSPTLPVPTTVSSDRTAPVIFNPTTYQSQQSVPEPSKNPLSDIIVFNEKQKNDLLNPTANDWWTIEMNKFIEQFYQTHEDNYDFIILFPTEVMQSDSSSPINRDISGIGPDFKPSNSSTKKLKTLIINDAFRIWQSSPEHPNFDSNLRGIMLHEIGHYWLDYINSKMGWNGDGAHYPYNLDLFNGDPSFVDPIAYYQWIRKDNQATCVNGNLTPHKFSNLSLYLMGLIPSESVQPVYFQQFNQKPGDVYYNMWGPNCDQPGDFTGTKIMTIGDIVNILGTRSPSSLESQKSFRAVFVILVPSGQSVPAGFVDYVNKYKEALPLDWNQATNGISSMSF